jgi:hypothetical protein
MSAPRIPEGGKPGFLHRFLLAYRKASGGSLLLSVLLHSIILIIGVFLVVSQVVEERKISFGGGEPGPKDNLQHKVQAKRKTTTAPAPSKRITTTSSIARVALPDMPDIPNNMGPSISGAMGSGGFGAAGGLGGGGGGGGAGGGMGGGFSKITFFGLNTSGKGEGLEGTFYDFKMTQGKAETETGRDKDSYIDILQGFKKPSNFKNSTAPPRYVSPNKLFTKFFFFPGIADSEAGPAFGSKDSKAGLWAAVYSGKFKANVSGRYRFVGTGDNVCAVKIDGQIVLDASDWGVFKTERENVGTLKQLGSKAGLPIYAGKWIELGGMEKSIDVIVGDQGGTFCAFVMIQKEGQTIELDGNGIPKLPLFITAPLTDPEKMLLKDLPPDSLSGPIFPARAASSSGAASSLLSPR